MADRPPLRVARDVSSRTAIFISRCERIARGQDGPPARSQTPKVIFRGGSLSSIRPNALLGKIRITVDDSAAGAGPAREGKGKIARSDLSSKGAHGNRPWPKLVDWTVLTRARWCPRPSVAGFE